MAYRVMSYWKAMLSRMGGNRTFFKSATPSIMPFPPTTDFAYTQQSKPRRYVKGEFVPVYVALGLIVLSMSFGAHTAYHHLRYCPEVRVSKKKRETLPEVVDPDHVVEEGDRFITNSFFRKLAHIQEFDSDHIIHDPIRGDVFARPRKAETLKSVGVDPSRI